MRSPRLVGSRALRAGAAAAFGFTLMVTAIGTVAAHAAPAVDCNRQGITWQNNHNGRYLEVRIPIPHPAPMWMSHRGPAAPTRCGSRSTTASRHSASR